ncbi:MAG: PrpF domain-containing protein [Candidatus Puniceispirillaceae bacterium]
MTNQTALPFYQFRGGSSKGLYFHGHDLPSDKAKREAVLKSVMGAHGDPRQIDGLGGGDPLSSKIAIITPSDRPGIDVDYQFIQAIIGEDRLDDTPNCGNILAGVGAFALETGLVTATGDEAHISVYMTNSAKICHLTFPIKEGLPVYEGDHKIDGVYGTSAPVICRYEGLAGSLCGALLPTGKSCDIIDGYQVTLIDNGMPVVMMRATDFGITGVESPDILNQNEDLKAKIESIRLIAGQMMGLGDVRDKAVPKMCLTSASQDDTAFSTRMFIPKQCHKAIGVLGAVTAASAACLPDSAVFDLAKVPDGPSKQLSIGHPSGRFDVQLDFAASEDGIQQSTEIISAGLLRTTRLLARGHAFIPHHLAT